MKYHRFSAFLAGLALLFATMAVPAAASDARVTVDGRTIAFDQPPIVQNGRVLVPLRGVFENLGATVVYDPGSRTIEATSSDGRSIRLVPGQRTATVDGQTLMMDVPAQVVAGRALVPLRFVAEALGAHVAWEPASKTAVIASAGGEAVGAVPAPPSVRVLVSAVVPAPGSIVGRLDPTVRWTYADALDPTSVRLVVDTRDLTSLAQISAHEVVWIPNYQMASGSHRAQVTALTVGGTVAKADWGFVLNPGTVSGYLIDSIQVGPDRPLTRGESVLVTMQGVPQGQATMDVGGNRDLAMREVRPGIYEGTYQVTTHDQGDVNVIVNLKGPDGRLTSLQANERVSLYGNPSAR